MVVPAAKAEMVYSIAHGREVIEEIVKILDRLVGVQSEGRHALQHNLTDDAKRTNTDSCNRHSGIAFVEFDNFALPTHQRHCDHVGGEISEPKSCAVRCGRYRSRNALDVDITEVG